jgi:hypothetical protein
MTPTSSGSPTVPTAGGMPPSQFGGDFASHYLKHLMEHLNEYIKKGSVTRNVVLSHVGTANEASSMDDARFCAALLEDPLLQARILIGLTGITAVASNAPEVDAKASAPEEAKFEGATVTDEALEFCISGGIRGDLKRGIELARKHFSANPRIRVYLESDPEDADDYAVLEVSSSGDSAVDLESYFKYMEEWSSSTKWPASRMILLDVRSAG